MYHGRLLFFTLLDVIEARSDTYIKYVHYFIWSKIVFSSSTCLHIVLISILTLRPARRCFDSN